LAPQIAIIAAPIVGAMLLSSEKAMHSLDRWYLAPVIPILFGAIAVLLDRLSEQKAKWIVLILLASSVAGYFLFSGGPLGGEFESHRYEVDERAEKAWEIMQMIPDDAVVSSQVAFITPLADREEINLYPWHSLGQENIQYYMMGRGFDAYPIQSDELDWEINNLIVDPDIVVGAEADGIYLLHQGGQQNPSFSIDAVAEDSIRIDRIEAAVADADGLFHSAEQEPLAVQPGQLIRVTLYWEALDAPEAERTVSVRIEDAEGAIVGQQDMMPVQGSRPTSWWQPGWQLRDVYYLEVDPNAAAGPASLDLVLYDSFNQERIPFEGIGEKLQLIPMEITEPSADAGDE
jgi:hypothetical protein